jgi:SNF2 family DNA or RNA helicase
MEGLGQFKVERLASRKAHVANIYTEDAKTPIPSPWGAEEQDISVITDAAWHAVSSTVPPPSIQTYLVIPLAQCPTFKNAAGVSFSLHPHQRQSVGCVIDLCKKYKCALLADDMGLGKTIQAISIVAIDRLKSPTLIVVPSNLLSHWHAELNKLHEPKLSVVTYVGKDREIEFDEKVFMKADIVITTEAILRMEYSRGQGAWETLRRTQALHVIPVRIPLMTTKWGRLICDEAHNIFRKRSSLRHKAACQVEADFRIGLSGTPFQNEYWSLYGMLRFFRFSPWDDEATFKRVSVLFCDSLSSFST